MSAGSHGLERFLKRLLIRSELTADEQEAIRSLPRHLVKYKGRHDLVVPGEEAEHVSIVSEGIVGRFEVMASGSRAIAELFVPGDACDLSSLIAPRAGWGLTALNAVEVVQIAHSEMRKLLKKHPALGLAFWRDCTVDAGVLAKWVANVGRMDAKARVAHLFCELSRRAEAAGLGTRLRYSLELTQDQVGDAMGLTSVHVNRTLAALRNAGAVTFRSHVVEIVDWDLLASTAEFDGAFLALDQPHLARRGAEPPAASTGGQLVRS